MTLEEQIAAVRRELALRKAVYPKWVMNGRIKQETADQELAAMQAVHDTLLRVNDLLVEQYGSVIDLQRELRRLQGGKA
jgi:hypothetical protein